MRRRLLSTVIGLVAGAASLAPAHAQSFSAKLSPAQPSSAQQSAPSAADRDLARLYGAYWTWYAAEQRLVPDGEGAFEPGGGLPRVDPETQRRREAFLRDLRAQLDRVAAAQLSEDEAINAAVLRALLDAALDDARFREWEAPFNSDSSFWTYLDESAPLDSVEDYRRYIARMRDIPRYFDEQIVNMRAGLARGFSAPRVTITGRDVSIAGFISEKPEDNAFYKAFAAMPRSVSAADQTALRAEAAAAIREAVVPAYRQLLDFYRREYVPRTRTTISVQALPDGAAYYAAQIRKYTTLSVDPGQVHAIGLKEVARIDGEMRQTMRDSGFKGTFAEYLQFLRSDPQFYAKTPEELLMVSAYVAKRVDGRIARTIGLLPRRPFTIVPVADALAPFYTAGRGGLDSCQMNTYDLKSRPLYAIPALTLHECSPGHSFQAALATERKQAPEFRRDTYFSGFGEGWGLYAEHLGIEMGIYRTPYENFGRLSYAMWRAARLVIDTGIHQHGWSRDRSIAYLADHTALSRREVESEVDRYISWPGQALSYKLGEMTILRLRGEAEAALGARFDQRRFHDAILALGSVPLPTLETRIARFIADEKQRAPTMVVDGAAPTKR